MVLLRPEVAGTLAQFNIFLIVAKALGFKANGNSSFLSEPVFSVILGIVPRNSA